MKVFTAYLRQHKRVLAFYGISMAVFFILLFFYRVPLAGWGYGAVLCLFFGLVLGVPDYLVFQRKHRELERLAMQQEIAGREDLPEPGGLLEKDYQEVIFRLTEIEKDVRDGLNRRYQDMSDYYTTWAHQVKTPIAALKLRLENEDSPLAREVRGEVVRIDQYVDMAMCYLRLDSETTDYVFEECGMDGIIRQAVKKFSPSFIQRKIRLEYRPMDWKVVTDEKWLLFVLEQILSNSLKYTRPQGKVSIERLEGEVLCIRDDGIGIAPEDIPRIFEKGYTGYNGRNDKKASGLGLYLCRRICTNLGHRIWASSALGEGTAVYLDLNRHLTKM